MDILGFIKFILFQYIHSNQQVLTSCCSVSHVQLSGTPWTATHQTSLSFTISQSLLKLLSIELMMPYSHLILCHPLLLLPPSFPASGSFPMYWFFTSDGQSIGASASTLSPNNEYSGLISFKLDWFDLLLFKGFSRLFSSITVWKYQFFGIQPSLWSNSHIRTRLLERPLLFSH